jgi:hypothetical protein
MRLSVASARLARRRTGYVSAQPTRRCNSFMCACLVATGLCSQKKSQSAAASHAFARRSLRYRGPHHHRPECQKLARISQQWSPAQLAKVFSSVSDETLCTVVLGFASFTIEDVNCKHDNHHNQMRSAHEIPMARTPLFPVEVDTTRSCF